MTIYFGDGTTQTTAGTAGKVLQCVSATKLDTASGTADSSGISGLSVSITPSSSSHKIWIQCNINCHSSSRYHAFLLYRDSTSLAIGNADGSRARVNTNFGTINYGGQNDWANSPACSNNRGFSYLDSPSSTSSIEYKVGVDIHYGGGTWWINRPGQNNNSSFISRMSSTITAFEIVA